MFKQVCLFCIVVFVVLHRFCGWLLVQCRSIAGHRRHFVYVTRPDHSGVVVLLFCPTSWTVQLTEQFKNDPGTVPILQQSKHEQFYSIVGGRPISFSISISLFFHWVTATSLATVKTITIAFDHVYACFNAVSFKTIIFFNLIYITEIFYIFCHDHS